MEQLTENETRELLDKVREIHTFIGEIHAKMERFGNELNPADVIKEFMSSMFNGGRKKM